MARRKNATFQGSRMPDVARDALIVQRWIYDAAGDFALTFDKVTGANAHSSSDTINHTGSGRGCPLHLPLTSQRVNRSVALVTGSTSDDYYILAVPVFNPAGQQTRFILEMDVSDLIDPYVEVRDSAWAVTFGPQQMIQSSDISTDSFRFPVTLASGAWQYLLVKARLFAGDQTFTKFDGWRLYPDYSRNKANGLNPPTTVGDVVDYPVLPTLTPTVASQNDIDDGMVDEGLGTGARPLDAYVLTRLNRMIGTFWEYLTGAKIPGRNTYGSSTTRDLDQANFTAEPEIDFPIATICLSAVLDAPTSKAWLTTYTAPTSGPTDHLRLLLTQNSGVTVPVSQLRAWVPPFRTTAGSRRLKLEILVARYDAGDNLAPWVASVNETTTGVTTADFALAQIGTTDFWRATVTDVPFSVGIANNFIVRMRCTTTTSPIDLKVVVLGYTLAFDP